MQVRNPCIWRRFLEFCEHHSDHAIAVFTAIGRQVNFEQPLEGPTSESLDCYIERRLNDSLEGWTKPLEEEERKENEEPSSEDSQLNELTP